MLRTILVVVPLVISLLVFLGAAVVYLRGSKDKGTIETLQRNNAALNDRVDILEREGEAKDTRISALEASNEVLVNTVNSSEAISELSALVLRQTGLTLDHLGEHHTAAMERITELHDDLSGLPVAIATAIGSTIADAITASGGGK